MRKINLLLGLILLINITAITANASIVTYTDRASFEIATGASDIEDFESYLTNTPFHTVAVNVGDFTLSMIGSPSTFYNYIDIAPPDSSETNVNGSTNMRVFTDNSPLSNLVFEFDTAITAFGADFRSLNDTVNRTQLLVESDIVNLPIASSSGLFSFFGFRSDLAFTSITFQGLENDVYGIDNVTYNPVPLPGVFWLLVSGLAGLAVPNIRKKIKQ